MAIVFPPVNSGGASAASLSALQTDITTIDSEVDAVQADIGNPSGANTDLFASLKYLYHTTAAATMASVVDDSIIGHILAKNGDVSDFDDETDSLEALYDALSGNIAAANRVAGKVQCSLATIDLNQAAGTYDLFTGTSQDILVNSLIFRMPNEDISSNSTLATISITTDDATPQVFIPKASGVVTNLTAEAQLAAAINGVIVKTGKKIQLTIEGGAVGYSVVADIVAEHRAVTNGGYLA